MSRPIIETPRGKIITVTTKAGKVKAQLKWNTARFSGSGGGASGGTPTSWGGKFSRAQRFVDSEVLRYCEPFIPLRTGMLIKSGILGTEIGSGEVKWIAPYSRSQYYSARKPGSTSGPQRGPYWFERMKSKWRDTIIRGAKRLMGG